jgi:hypothetical protein
MSNVSTGLKMGAAEVSGLRVDIADVFPRDENEFFNKWGNHLTVQQRKVFRNLGVGRTAACGAMHC